MGLLILLILLGITGIGVGIYVITQEYTVSGIIAIFASIIIFGGSSILYANSASFQRHWKDFKSDYGNGIDRTITITAEDGRVIYEYSGRVDLEIDDRKIKFEDEHGDRQIIIFGVTDTVTIIEN